MHRIDTSSRQKDKFGAGKDGFTQGDPQTGTQATQVSATFLGSIQEEIAAVIEDSDSGATLNKSKNNQLVTAIKSIIRSAGMLATETVNGVIKIASQSQTNAGVADDVAITPKKLRAGISMMLGSVGYICLPTWMGGVIIQWGVGIGASTYDFGISFPIAFPTACWGATVSCDYTAESGNVGYVACKKERTRLVCRSSGTYSTNWIAIGA